MRPQRAFATQFALFYTLAKAHSATGLRQVDSSAVPISHSAAQIPDPAFEEVPTGDSELQLQLERLRTDLESALPQVVPALHGELRQLAAAQRRRFAAPATLSTTAVVNELYLKFAQSKGLSVESRRHFFALAAMAMRQILIDHARARLRAAQETEPGWLPADVQPQDLIEMDTLLKDLALAHPRLAQVVTCRYFAGYSEVETAEVLGVTDRTVRRDWDKARAWLGAALS